MLIVGQGAAHGCGSAGGRSCRARNAGRGLDVADNIHDLRLGLPLREKAEGGESTDDGGHGRDDGQGQQHLRHLPPDRAFHLLSRYPSVDPFGSPRWSDDIDYLHICSSERIFECSRIREGYRNRRAKCISAISGKPSGWARSLRWRWAPRPPPRLRQICRLGRRPGLRRGCRMALPWYVRGFGQLVDPHGQAAGVAPGQQDRARLAAAAVPVQPQPELAGPVWFGCYLEVTALAGRDCRRDRLGPEPAAVAGHGGSFPAFGSCSDGQVR